MSDASVLVAVAVVDRLHAAAARSVVFSGCQLHLAVVRKGTDRLHEALAIAAGTDDGTSVVVLDGSGNDFRSGS